MIDKGQPKKPSHRHKGPPFLWCLAVLSALVWHLAVFWWLGLESLPVASAKAHAPTAMRVAPEPYVNSAEPFADEIHLLWSPVVFALPTHVGFSAQLMAKRVDARPPLNASRESSMYLNRMKSDQRALTTTDVVPLGNVLRYDPIRLSADVPPGRSFMHTDGTMASASISIIQHDGSLELVDTARFSIQSDKVATDAWEVTARVEVDHGGAVERVILEEGASAPVLNTEIIRAIRRCRFNKGEHGRSAQVRVYFMGAPEKKGAP